MNVQDCREQIVRILKYSDPKIIERELLGLLEYEYFEGCHKGFQQGLKAAHSAISRAEQDMVPVYHEGEDEEWKSDRDFGIASKDALD